MLTIKDIKAGKSIFTISNDKDEHYTYKVTKSDPAPNSNCVYFVSLLTGADNTKSYTYMGLLFNNVRLTSASKYNENSLPLKVINWAIKRISSNKPFPTGYSISHAGYCLKCGRLLTTPESIKSGYGSVCLKGIG